MTCRRFRELLLGKQQTSSFARFPNPAVIRISANLQPGELGPDLLFDGIRLGRGTELRMAIRGQRQLVGPRSEVAFVSLDQ